MTISLTMPTAKQIKSYQSDLRCLANKVDTTLKSNYSNFNVEYHLGIGGLVDINGIISTSYPQFNITDQMLWSAILGEMHVYGASPVATASHMHNDIRLMLTLAGVPDSINATKILRFESSVEKPTLIQDTKPYALMTFCILDNAIRPAQQGWCVAFDEQNPSYLHKGLCPDTLKYPVFDSRGIYETTIDTKTSEWRAILAELNKA